MGLGIMWNCTQDGGIPANTLAFCPGELQLVWLSVYFISNSLTLFPWQLSPTSSHTPNGFVYGVDGELESTEGPLGCQDQKRT